MKLIPQLSIFMTWMYYSKSIEIRSPLFNWQTINWSEYFERNLVWSELFRAHSLLVRSEIRADNSLIRNFFDKIVRTMFCVWSGPRSQNRLDNFLISVWSEVNCVWQDLTRDNLERKCFECSWAWSVDTSVLDGLISGYFCLTRFDRRSLQENTSTVAGFCSVKLLDIRVYLVLNRPFR